MLESAPEVETTGELYDAAPAALFALDAASWSEIAPGAGRLTCFVRPRALA